MVEIAATTLISAFGAVGSWLDRLIKTRATQDEAHRLALSKIYVASNETKFYMSRLNEGKRRSRNTERSLAALWTEAAVDLRKIDQELAERCLLKGDYWADPKKWTDSQIKKARIGVDRVFRDARKLMGQCS